MAKEKNKAMSIVAPMKMFISYNLKDINNRNIETYEIEVLFRRDEMLDAALFNLKKQLDNFCNEAEGVIEAITKDYFKT